MTTFLFTHFAYFDTNIYSHLAKNPELWSPLCKFLLDNDLCFSFSSANLAELADAKHLHGNLTNLILSMPSAVLKPWDMILEEEVTSHPNYRKDSLDLDRIIRLATKNNGHKELERWFASERLINARKDQLQYAELMKEIHESIKSNYPPEKAGSYKRNQANEFSELITLQWLAGTHLSFLKQYKHNVENLNLKIFQSTRIFGLVIFYKYYLGNRRFRKTSDFGDLGHLCFLPYCDLVIIERDLCEVLNQIKKHHDILGSTRILNIDFFKD